MKRVMGSAVLALVLVVDSVLAACGSGGSSGTTFTGLSPDGGGGDDATIAVFDSGGSQFSSSGGDSAPVDANGLLVVSPTTPTVAVTLGTTPNIPTTQFTATYNGTPVNPNWSVDRGEIGAIGVTSGVFTPTATLGGVANVTADYQGHLASTAVTVDISNVADGDPNAPDGGVDAGSGGYGGVGGSGEGAPANPVQFGILNGSATTDPNIGFLYPYDQTVFPQGILAPLLQWSTDGKSFDAVLIHIKENAYEYKGYFQAPATPFQNHPIPQAVWNAVSYSNQGEPVTVELTFAISSLNQAWGPITRTFVIAQGELQGTIYYQSYGTNLAHNYCCTFDGANFGGATLAIKQDNQATGPTLVAGNDTECRVCHSVSANGSTLITQQGSPGSYPYTSEYALTNGYTETTIANNNTGGRFRFAGLFPDGTKMLSQESPSVLYDLTGTPIPNVTGWPNKPGTDAGVSAMLPAFSPDGTHVAFNSDGTSLGTVDFDKTATFSNFQSPLATPSTYAYDGGTPLATHDYWPSFLPTNDGIIYERELVSNGRDVAGTRSQCDQKGPVACQNEGTHAELWWLDLKSGTPTRLDNLNGLGYLPPHPTYTGPYGDDSTLNYEPTVNPVPSGGYIWVVFTSRRAYGNVATINPYWSDPRFEDLSATPTTKKLWVAAIDLNPTPGKDPSHPGFYLPAQELLAGNARGFWVVDPCHPTGTSCVTGEECCTGYCEPGEDGGPLQCTTTQPSCSQQYEKCSTTADCCAQSPQLSCIDGLCSLSGPK